MTRITALNNAGYELQWLSPTGWLGICSFDTPEQAQDAVAMKRIFDPEAEYRWYEALS